MKVVEHLTKEQLAGYAARSVGGAEEHEIGKHLLQCPDCRNLMPEPTPEQFWSALLDETEQERGFEPASSLPPFSAIFAFFRQPLAWGTLALILAVGFSILIWVGAVKRSDSGNDVARTDEMPKIENNLPPDEKLPVLYGDENQKIESLENPQQSPRPKHSGSNLPLQTANSKEPVNTEDRELALLLEHTPPAVLSLRPNEQMILRGGDKQTSNPAPTFRLLAPVGETVLETTPVFRWEKVANAKSYQLSIFDAEFNEVLTTQVSENSFKTGNALKRGAKYLWRVAAQTEGGEMISPLPPRPPAMFRIAEEKSERRIELLKKNEADRFKLAVFYAEEGMLDSAACTLKEILAKNPKHIASRRLLAKVEQWKKENQTATQRCGAPTTTKADQ